MDVGEEGGWAARAGWKKAIRLRVAVPVERYLDKIWGFSYRGGGGITKGGGAGAGLAYPY